MTISDGDHSPTSIASLYIGSGAQLKVTIHNVVQVAGATTIASNGTLDLDGTYTGANAGNAALGGGTVTNQGTIIMQGSGYSATLYGTIVNRGTLNVVDNTAQICNGGNGGSGSFDNQGTITIAGTASDPSNPPVLQVVGCTFTNDTGGNITNSGGFTIEPYNSTPANYTQGNGTESGNAVYVYRGTTLDYTGTGASSVEVASSTSMTGNIAAGQALQVDIGTVVTEPGSFTNAGTILLNGNYYGGGGGPAEISSPGTITNTGTITAESNDNDPSINGSFVNAGTLAITPNTEVEQLAGTFTNAAGGTIEPEFSSTQSSDIRFDTNTTFVAGGTLAPQLEGGFTPAVGQEYDVFVMKGGSYNGTFGTIAGNWHGDYANTGYLAVMYGPSAASSPPPPSVGPPTTSQPGGDGGAALIKATHIGGGAALIKATLSCATGASCARYAVTGTVTAHLKGAKVTAVSARAARHTKKTTRKTKVVTVASATGTLAAGTSKVLTIKLNRAGEALLKRFVKLRVKVTVAAGGKTIETTTVTVTKTKAKRKR